MLEDMCHTSEDIWRDPRHCKGI